MDCTQSFSKIRWIEHQTEAFADLTKGAPCLELRETTTSVLLARLDEGQLCISFSQFMRFSKSTTLRQDEPIVGGADVWEAIIVVTGSWIAHNIGMFRRNV